MTTFEVASYMLKQGKPYTAALLARELSVSLAVASGKLYNIKTTHRYSIKLSQQSPITVEVTDIDGMQRKECLWRSILQS
ncbi:hypothetical protein ACP3V5_17275 [Vibrio maritimus]|jgi:hypothetical protein